MEQSEKISPFDLAEKWYNAESSEKKTITALAKRLVRKEQWTTEDEKIFLIRRAQLQNPNSTPELILNKKKKETPESTNRKKNYEEKNKLNDYLLEKCNQYIVFKDCGELFKEWYRPGLEQTLSISEKNKMQEEFMKIKNFSSLFWIKATRILAMPNFFPNQKKDTKGWSQQYSWLLALRTFKDNEEKFEYMLGHKSFVDRDHLENSILFFLKKNVNMSCINIINSQKVKEIQAKKEQQEQKHHEENSTHMITIFKRRKRTVDENLETQAEKDEKMRQKLKEIL